MNTGTVIVVVLIVLWGALEYQRRERKQKEVLASLKQGLPVSLQPPRAPLWRLLGLGLTAFLMTATAAFMAYGAFRGVAPAPVLYGMAVSFGSMTVIVALMLARDARPVNDPTSGSPKEES